MLQQWMSVVSEQLSLKSAASQSKSTHLALAACFGLRRWAHTVVTCQLTIRDHSVLLRPQPVHSYALTVSGAYVETCNQSSSHSDTLRRATRRFR